MRVEGSFFHLKLAVGDMITDTATKVKGLVFYAPTGFCCRRWGMVLMLL